MEEHRDLGCWGRLGSCICVFAKEDGGAGFMPQEPPSTDAFLPLPFLTLTLCPHVGGAQGAPSWSRDCPRSHGCPCPPTPRGRAGGGGGLTASGQGPPGASCPGFLYLTV